MDSRARPPRRGCSELTEPCPWRPSVFPVGPFGSTDHGSGRQRRRPARPIAARAHHVPPGYQGRGFSSRHGSPPTVRRHILVRSFQEEQPQLRRRQRPVMRGARPPFHGAITARSGVNSRCLSCQENSAQDRSIAPAAEAGALESLAVSMMSRRWLGSAESAFAGWLPSLSILFFWTA